jgi:Tol biopolymer transport system component
VAVVGFFGGQFIKETPSLSEPNFKLLTFGKGYVKKARFTADGNTIIYSAAWNGNPLSLYSTRIDGSESLPLDVPKADLLSISSQGELAILLLPQSTIARVPISGGTPRKIKEYALDADWAPDGNNMAIHGQGGGEDWIEYPVGNVIYKTTGNIKSPTVSPNGMMVAFAQRPGLLPPDSLEIVDRSGKKKTYKEKEWVILNQVVWHPSGKEVWVMAFVKGGAAFYAVPLEGKPRLVMKLDGHVGLQDISSNGDVLIIRNDDVRVETSGLAPGESTERNFSWLDGSHCFGTAENGKVLFFNEIRQGGGEKKKIYMRKIDASSPVRLGEGLGCSVSRDGNWVLAIDKDTSSKLLLLPTGAGEMKWIDTSPVENLNSCTFFPDGKRILFEGNEPAHNWRSYVLDLNGGRPLALTPEGFSGPGGSISPDGNLFSARDADGNWFIFSVHNGKSMPLPNQKGYENILRWNNDGRSVFVADFSAFPAKIYTLDIKSGHRELKREIRLADPAGVDELLSLQLSEDAQSYYYSYQRTLSDLYLVNGLRY